MNRKILALIGFIAAVVIVVLLVINNEDQSPAGQEAENIKELVHDYSVGNIINGVASITGEQLIVTDSRGNETIYALPEDDFFVSIAPYVDETHPCTFHSLTGCQGEMVEEEFDIYIEGMDGSVLVDERLTSQANGFIDFWLPRDEEYNITIVHDDKMVQSTFSTFKSDATCLTTMQLE